MSIKIKKQILECRDTVIHYNEGQKEALERIENFLNDDKEWFFLLAGYSGTGKTTIAENIVKYANANVLAPTNTAVNRLRDKIQNSKAEFGTIHSCLFSPKDDNGGFKKEKSFTRNKTYVIDEVSMIDKFVLDTVIKDAVERECKIIFLGDSFQLQPVGDDPKIFDWEKSYPDHFKVHNKFELTQVTRYDGSLLKIATELRTLKKSIITMPENSDLLITQNQFNNELGKCIDNNESFTVLTATNKERVKYNKMIRKFKFRKTIDPNELPDTILKKEKLISISNSVYYANGEIFEEDNFIFIDDVELIIYPVTYNKGEKKDKTLFGDDRFKPKPVKVYKFLLYKKKSSSSSNSFDSIFSTRTNTEYILFSPDIEEPSYHGATMLKAVRKDGNYEIKCKKSTEMILFTYNSNTNTTYWNKNVTICTYGYALSTHKSQGQEWDYVFISSPFLMDVWDHARWFYTAITRAKKKVQLINNSYLKIR